MIAVATGSMVGRVMSVNAVDKIGLEEYLRREYAQGRRRADDWRKQRPFLSANDRSRWCTIRALVEHGTYEIDQIVDQPNWDTIDMVMHENRQGQMRRYSSKPPLLATLLAGEYWVIYKLTGKTLGDEPYRIGRFMLVTFNVLPMVLMFYLLGKLADRFGTTDWARLLMMAGATFGTFLTTFAVVLNNHLPAAISVILALYAAVRIVFDGERRLRYFGLAGLFGAFTAANELPALSFLGILGGGLLWLAPRPTLMAFLPAALIVGAASVGTNYAAHGTWKPPYAFRDPHNPKNNWYDYEYIDAHGRKRESYWRQQNKQGLDRGEPSRAVYALHVLVGHHGIFSLTPLWLLSVVGGFAMLRHADRRWQALALGIGLCSLVCLGFYLSRGLDDRNYGGLTSGFRWMFWFAPLWLVLLLPAGDLMAGRRWTRAIALLLLGASVLSAAYPTWNPWTQPWIFDYLRAAGAIKGG
jgi:hypothetical protein